MSNGEQDNKKIGQLNGRWSMLLRIALATYPLFIAWGVWTTTETFANSAFRNSGDRFTKSDALVMEAKITEKINAAQSDIKERLVRLETKLEAKGTE